MNYKNIIILIFIYVSYRMYERYLINVKNIFLMPTKNKNIGISIF